MNKTKFFSKIRVKITGAMILCSLIMALLIGSIGIFINYKFFNREITEKLSLLSQDYSNNFNIDFKAIESRVNTLNNYVSATFNLKELNLNPNKYVQQYENITDSIIKKAAENTKGVEAVYFTFNPKLTGNVHEIWYADKHKDGHLKRTNSDPSGNYLKEFYPNNINMKWYYDAAEKRKGVWSNPYEETDLKINILSYTEPIFINNVLIGVVGIDINIDLMSNAIKKMKIYDTGFAFLMNENYDFIVHPIYSLVDNLKVIENGKLEYLTKTIGKTETGIIKYKFNGQCRVLGYSHMCNGWVLGFQVPMKEAYSPLIYQLIISMIVAIISTIIMITVALYIGKSISQPIVNITQLMKSIGKFNFDNDESFKALTENKDEIGVMAHEMIHMRRMLKETGVDKAGKIQRKALQMEFPISNKVNMDVLYVPAKTVSGDFYHLEKINDSLVIGVIWDVSGKGVTAALNTSAFNILFHKAITLYNEPMDIIKELNSKVASFLGQTYIAACCFSFDFENNTAKIVGAGINEFMYSSKEGCYQPKEVKGPFLGMFKENMFDEEIIHFESGDKFYFLSDGLESMFTDENLRARYINISDTNELIKLLNNYITEQEAKDDLKIDDCTLVVFEIEV